MFIKYTTKHINSSIVVMAIWNSKPYLTIFVFFLFLLHKTKSESLSFSFDHFEPELFPIALVGDARSDGGVIQLTRRDQTGEDVTIRQHSVGRAVYVTPIHLWDRQTGNVADFTTEFTFVVDSGGSVLRGDGLAFFIASEDAAFHIPVNSTGGYLGLFGPKTAFEPTKKKIVAVELDSFGNEWDPSPEPLAAHVGIDVNSLKSVRTTNWPINSVPKGSLGKAKISHDSKKRVLSVEISYGGGTERAYASYVEEMVDLKDVLPEWVRIGFAASTGDLVESHDIVSWSFTSFLLNFNLIPEAHN